MRAPVYLTYRECIKGLYNQGIRAFFKGATYNYLLVSMKNMLHVGLIGQYVVPISALKPVRSYSEIFSSRK